MLLRLLAFVALLCTFCPSYAQKKDVNSEAPNGYVFIDLTGDTIRYKDRATITLRLLKKGSVIVRLKTSERSIEAYRKAGQNNIADKIVLERKAQNQSLYNAFIKEFFFCKVFFIFSKDTKLFLDGAKNIFLNSNLEYDSTIAFTDSNFVFCEFGSVETYSKFTDQVAGYSVPMPSLSGGMYMGRNPHDILDTVTRRTSSSPATTSGLFFSDKDLKQFQRPFPFSEAVYLNNPYPTVRQLNRELERVYNRLVQTNDYRLKLKEERKKSKQKRKKEKWIP